MNEDLEIETYLYISPNFFGIYLFDFKSKKNLFKEEINLNYTTIINNLKNLDTFLKNNIFKIEKLLGKFIKNISIIIEDNLINYTDIGIKNKNYKKTISKKNLENTLVDAKDLFNKNFYNYKIMHILLTSYFVDGNKYSSFKENLIGDHFCIELKFIYISKELSLEIEKILEKYQISIKQYLDGKYIKDLFKDNYTTISELAFNAQNRFNENEIILIPKNKKKKGIFEKFFQLFS